MKEKIDFRHINKKGDEKNVTIYVDKITYKLLWDSNLDESVKINYLKEIYLENNKENYLKKKENRIKDIMIISGSYEYIESPQEYYEKKLFKENMITCLNNLKPIERQIIELIFFEGKRMVDVANILNRSKSTISKRLNVILNKLRKELNIK